MRVIKVLFFVASDDCFVLMGIVLCLDCEL